MDGDGRDADDVVGVVEPIKKRVGGPSSWAALFFCRCMPGVRLKPIADAPYQT